MNQLLPEIINLIATFIDRYPEHPSVPLYNRQALPSNLPPYATISSVWKRAIEFITFREIDLKSTELEVFDTNLTGDRRELLRDLRLHVVLPNYDDQACGRFEETVDKEANDEVFSQAIEKVWAVLRSWEDKDVLMKGSIRFSLRNIYSPNDVGRRGFETLRQQRFEVNTGRRHDLFERRYVRSLIRLLRPDSLPVLRRVSVACLDSMSTTHSLNMRSIVDMTTKLLSLESLSWTLDDHQPYSNLRRINRNRCASALAPCSFPSLKIAHVEIYHEASSNHKFKPAVLSNPNHDPLSTAIRLAFSQSHTLTSLTLSGVIDSSLFWPASQSPDTSISHWPNLEFLVVKFDLTTPSGHWYFTDPSNPESGDVPTLLVERDDPEDSLFFGERFLEGFATDEITQEIEISSVNPFRTVPNPSLMSPLILAFAKAVKHMPSIVIAALTTGPLQGPDDTFQFEIVYYGPDGKKDMYGDEGLDRNSPRLYFEVGSWIPDEEVLRELREAWTTRWGTPILEKFLKGPWL